MVSANLWMGLPSVTSLLYLSAFLDLVSAHALPVQTKTVEFRSLNVQPWPVETAAPELAADLRRRQFNTVCGYIGGNPDLPATCSAGSHCAVDVEHGAIGCCPDGGACTAGVFTGCVDANSGPQTELNPYVYTCQGGNVCYRNSFEGGYFQYGCGSASDMGTSVRGTASGKEKIDITSFSAQLTATVVSLAEPTTLGTLVAETSETESASESESATSGGESSTVSSLVTSASTRSRTSATQSESTATESTATESTATESTATESTASESASRTRTSSESASSTAIASAPDTEDDDNGKKNTGAIVGGTISGVAALVAAVTIGIWCWRRKKGNQRQGPGLQANPQYIGPVSQAQHFSPIPSNQMDDFGPPPRPPPPSMPLAYGTTTDITSGGRMPSPEPYTSGGPYAYGAGAAVGGSNPLEHDQVPLTRDESREMDELTYGYNGPLTRIEEEPRPTSNGTGLLSPRARGGGPFYQQNRDRDLTWL